MRRGQRRAQNGHLAYLDAFPSSPQTQLSDAKLLSFICFIPTRLLRLPGPGRTAPAGLTGWAAVAALSLPEGSSVSPAVSTQDTVRTFSHYVNYATIFSFVSSKLITHNYNYRSNRRKTRIQPCKKIYKKSGYFLFYLSVTLF